MSDRHEQGRYLQGAPGGHHGRLGKFVCASCLEDHALKQFVLTKGKVGQCDYCGKSSAPSSVVPLDEVIDFMRTAIEEEWCDPADDAPWCSEDGGYQVETLDNDEILYEVGFEVSNQKLMADVSAAFADHNWCLRNWELVSPSKRWSFAWDWFQHVVKHQRRYTFWYSRDDLDGPFHADSLPPADMLGEIGG